LEILYFPQCLRAPLWWGLCLSPHFQHLLLLLCLLLLYVLLCSASVSVSASEKPSASSGFLKPGSSVSHKQVLITPLAGRLRGGGPTSEGQTSELGEMIKTADQFLARWATLSEEEREAFELEQTSNPEQAVVNEALKKNHLRTSQLLKTMAQQLSESKSDAAAARAAADAAIAAEAQQAAQVSKSEAIKRRAPPSYENKEKDLPIQKWLPIVESYLAECPDKDYLRNASSFLAGKPRSFYQSKYDLRIKSGPPIDNPVEFFRESCYLAMVLRMMFRGTGIPGTSFIKRLARTSLSTTLLLSKLVLI
jgi:hypothetical protein